ncbi:hypothetical protein pipiens_011401 [Culex pipiens pipiens]|uniref:Uncharacterized protein n=1 Tax=Culex pipiens pipiens TaxID=38569 RepID=A0ABD1D713_CULPP
MWEVVSEWRTRNDLDFKLIIVADSVGSVQINSENEATSPSQSAISPIETPVGGSGKDGILCPPDRTDSQNLTPIRWNKSRASARVTRRALPGKQFCRDASWRLLHVPDRPGKQNPGK